MAFGYPDDAASPPGTRLFLTFDDGPDPTWTPRVLEVLERFDASASFFMLGERIEEAPQIARAVLDAGHDVELHGHRHLRHSETPDDELEIDTSRALAALARIGAQPALWRTPWGVLSSSTESLARRHGLALVRWTIDSEDWRGEPAQVMLARIRDPARAGGTVLMHDALGPGATRGDCASTVDLLGHLLSLARRNDVHVGALAPGSRAAPGARE